MSCPVLFRVVLLKVVRMRFALTPALSLVFASQLLSQTATVTAADYDRARGLQSRYRALAIDVIDRVPRLKVAGAHAKEKFRDLQIGCMNYAYEHGVDKPEAANWKWPY